MVKIFSEISNVQLLHMEPLLPARGNKHSTRECNNELHSTRSALACLQELLPASVMDYKLAWIPTGMARYLCSVLIAQALPTNVQSEQKSEYHYLPLYFIYLYLARAGLL